MHKTFLIIRREYLTRVRKKSFIIMTILGPLLMAATIVIPVYLATRTSEKKSIAVLDESGVFTGKFTDSDNYTFHSINMDLAAAKETFVRNDNEALLYIPKPESSLPTNAIIYASKSVNFNITSYIKNVMSRQVEELKLQARIRELQPEGKSPVSVNDLLKSIKTNIDISTLKISDSGKESKSFTEINMILGMFSGFLIYFFILMFSSQVMRGVIEEKTSRIVEVIISSVKPFQLMMGKIIGVGMVGLTQFLLWVVLTFGIVTFVTTIITSGNTKKASREQMLVKPGVNSETTKMISQENNNTDDLGTVMEAIGSVDFPVMIGSFIFFFIFGFLLYAALFAAIGGAVDSETDTQQFMLPVTIPLALSLIIGQFTLQDPDGPLSFWLSFFPFTSPVIMMIRIAFSVPYYQVLISMALLILGFLGTTWMSGKIYRTGILMYGKKISYGELWKWLRYRG